MLHPGDTSARAKSAEIVAEYVQRFRQEAVLRERTVSCARF